VLGTHPDTEYATENVRRYVRYGSSPRGAQALILAAKVRALLENRFHVSHEDIDFIARPALRHRIILNFEGQADGMDTDTLVEELLERHAAVVA
jgi:MoxR-like ATPase